MNDPNDIPHRLAQLKSLEDGWLDGRGVAPSHAGLDWFADAIEARFPKDLPLPRLYPIIEGGVRLEWDRGLDSRQISLDVDLRRKVGEWHALDLDTDRDETRTLDLGDEKGWNWLNGRLAETIGASRRG